MQKLSGGERLQFGKASSFRYAFRKYNYEMKDEVYVPMAICSTCTKLIQLSTQNFGTQYPAVVMAMYFNHFFIFYFLFSFATSCSIAEEIHTKKRVDSSILIVDDVYTAAHICFMSGQKFREIWEE